VYFQAERAHPGLTEDFIGGVLEAELMRDKLSLPEALLRLALNDMDQYTLNSKDNEFVQLNYRARGIPVIGAVMSFPVARMSGVDSLLHWASFMIISYPIKCYMIVLCTQRVLREKERCTSSY
jgi:hypothetical protein